MQQSAQVSWLTPFFVRSPGEAWLGLIGLQRYLFGREFEALAMLSLVAGFALLVWRRRYVFPVLMGVSFVFWIALSAMGQVPLGSTRHSFMGNALLLPLIALPYGWALGRGLGGAVAAAAVAGAALSFPAIPRALTGADALHTRPSVEFVARAADLEEQVEFLKALRAEAHWILMDRQTWNMLSPLWVEAGVFPERRQDYFRYAYDWGRARIGVTEGWILRVRPDEPRQLQHLAVAIRQYGRVVPRWQEADRKAWLFLGGWGADSAVVLRAADHRLSPEGPPIFDAILETPALLRARVDFRQYLERLEPSQAAE